MSTGSPSVCDVVPSPNVDVGGSARRPRARPLPKKSSRNRIADGAAPCSGIKASPCSSAVRCALCATRFAFCPCCGQQASFLFTTTPATAMRPEANHRSVAPLPPSPCHIIANTAVRQPAFTHQLPTGIACDEQQSTSASRFMPQGSNVPSIAFRTRDDEHSASASTTASRSDAVSSPATMSISEQTCRDKGCVVPNAVSSSLTSSSPLLLGFQHWSARSLQAAEIRERHDVAAAVDSHARMTATQRLNDELLAYWHGVLSDRQRGLYADASSACG